MFQTWTKLKSETFRRPAMPTRLFHLENVSVNFGKIMALKSVQLTISPGEVIFITGASGAGKTTLLNVLAGDVIPNSGRIFMPDRRVFISQVFQDLKLLNHMTCEENLWLSYDSTIYRSRAEFHADMQELARAMGISDRLSTLVEDANGGLKQKIAMIRALLSRPEVVLADEPTSALDRMSAQKLFEILNFYNTKRGTTIIWATHSKDLIKQFPGKIIHLDNGKLVYSGHACFI